MCNSEYVLSYVDGLGTSYARLFLASTHATLNKKLDRKLSARFSWFTGIYKKKLLCIFQATNDVMFLS